MAGKCLDQMSVIALLINGAYILRVEPEVFGSTSYYVQMPGDAYDMRIGHITAQCAQRLYDAGFIVSSGNVVRSNGKVLSCFKLEKPNISKFLCKSSAPVDDDK